MIGLFRPIFPARRNKRKLDETRHKLLEPLANMARAKKSDARLTLELEGIHDYYFQITAIRGRMKK